MLNDSSLQLWNADEAGFPLCPKTGQILSMKADKNVYAWCNRGLLRANYMPTYICAAGEVLPPMEVFAGKRFRYNPMENCTPILISGTHAPNGWINTELFLAGLLIIFLSW